MLSLTINDGDRPVMSGGLHDAHASVAEHVLVASSSLTFAFRIRKSTGVHAIEWEPAKPPPALRFKSHVDDVNRFRFPT